MSRGITLTDKQIQERTDKIYPDRFKFIKRLPNGKALFLCKVHKLHFEPYLYKMNGITKGCDKCAKASRAKNKTLELGEYQKRLESKVGDKHFVQNLERVKSEKSSKVKSIINIKCLLHGAYNQLATDVGRYNGCPKCPKRELDFSNEEKNEIVELLKKQGLHKEKGLYISLEDKRKLAPKRASEFLIQCNKHLEKFWIRKHLLKKKGTTCEKCQLERLSSQRSNIATYIDFKREGKIIYNNQFNYPLNPLKEFPFKNRTSKVQIECTNCDSYFQKNYVQHIQKKTGCPFCKQKSLGENIVQLFLEKTNIIFETQKRFKECKHKNELPFDFYLSKYNLLIEYDGEAHFEEMKIFHKTKKDFKLQQKRDSIKNDFVVKKGFNFIRIPYTKKNEIERIIKENISLIEKGDRVYVTSLY